jgi:CheY-like chemotaxis protein
LETKKVNDSETPGAKAASSKSEGRLATPVRHTIVIVEDNPADSKMLRMALARRDPTIETVLLEDGAEAIDFFSSDAKVDGSAHCDLILLDLNLPYVSGFDVLEFLKGHPELKKTPVIVLSGSSSAADVERCYLAGANSYICKPTGLDAVFNMVEQLVGYWLEQAQLPASVCSATK